MKGMIPPTQWITVKETLKDVTQNVLKTLFVPIPKDENIQLRTCQIYGIPGTGKTSLYRWFGFKGLQHYTKDNINLIESTNLDVLLDSIEPVPVNFLFLEDAGLETQSAGKELIAKFSRVRHIHGDVLEDKGKERRGVDDVFFAVQDPFLLEKKLRSTLHVEILKNAPTNDYDKGILVKNMGREALKQLELINKRVFQQHKYQYLSHCVARAVDDVGYFIYDFIPSKDSVIKTIESIDFSEVSVLSGLIPSDLIGDTENLGFYNVLVKYFTNLFSKFYKNEKHIISSYLYKHFTPLNLSYETILNRLKNKLNYPMISRKGSNIRVTSLNKITNDFQKTVEKERRVFNKKKKQEESKKDYQAKISNTLFGMYLENVFLEALNSELKRRGFQQSFSRFGKELQPDLLLGSELEDKNSLVINVKFRDNDRTSHRFDSTPENDYQECWMAWYQPKFGLFFQKNHERKEFVGVRNSEGKSIKGFFESIENQWLKSTSINCPECGKPMTTEDYHFYHCSNCPTTYVPDGSILLDEDDEQ